MSVHLFINDQMIDPPVVTIDTAGIPEAIMRRTTDIGHAFRGFLDLLGIKNELHPDGPGARLFVSGSLLAIQSALDTPDLAQQIAGLVEGCKDAEEPAYSRQPWIHRILMELATKTLPRMAPNTPLTRVVGAMAHPFADAAHDEIVVPHYGQTAYWRLAAGQEANANAKGAALLLARLSRSPVTMAQVMSEEL